jgi:Domain of unknown function (DUF4389)/zinc-ribbon domain
LRPLNTTAVTSGGEAVQVFVVEPKKKVNVAFCTNCGTELRENQSFCTVCGAPTSGAPTSDTPTGVTTAMPRLSSDEVIHEARVRVGLSMEPLRQSRWTVLFRGLMTIPLSFVAAVIGLAAVFVSIFAWFAALFMGRVPDGSQRFLTGAIRLYANVLAYSYLLIPRWPGIVFSPRLNSQVTLEADHVRLNRAAVFFRIILAYPANIVSGLLSLGALPIVLVMWLWGIAAGREPRALHQAVALVLRYQVRFQAYGSLVTPTQPFRGLFGDDVIPTAAPVVASPSSSDVATTALPTRWIVSRGARAVVVVMLVVGVPVFFAVAVIERPLITKVQDVVSRTIAASAYTTTINAMSNFQYSVENCPSTSAYVGCAAKAATTASTPLTTASNVLANTSIFPSDAQSLARTLQGDMNQLKFDVSEVQFSGSPTTSMNYVKSEIPAALANFKQAYSALKAKLSD